MPEGYISEKEFTPDYDSVAQAFGAMCYYDLPEKRATKVNDILLIWDLWNLKSSKPLTIEFLCLLIKLVCIASKFWE